MSEFLSPLSFIIQIATNVIVFANVMPMFRVHRLRFFAVLGLSALLGIFVSVMFWKMSQWQMSEQAYYQLWCALTILGILDLILYTVGIIQMVRHFQSRVPEKIEVQQSSSGNSTSDQEE